MKKSSSTLIIACLTLFVSSLVSGYVLLNPKRTWQSAPTYWVDESGVNSIDDIDGGVTATVNAITSSSNSWNGAGAGNVVKAKVDSMVGWQLGDGVPMLNFSDPEAVCTGSCLAATFTGFYSTEGRGRSRKATVFDADIVTNTAYKWTSQSEDPGGVGCSGEFYIEAIQVHEIGHGLGLGHSNTFGATMYPSVSSCNNGPAVISADDKAGLCALYGCDDGGSSGGGGNSCDLLGLGQSCSSNGQCCSGKCRGPSGRKTCK